MRSGIRPTAAELGIERVPWEDLGPEFLSTWGRPGGRFQPEHLTVYGQTGSGKSYFVGNILKARYALRGSHTVILATKRDDGTLRSLGWPVINKWPPRFDQPCVIYWAAARGLSAQYRVPQRKRVRDLLDALWVPGSNRVVYIDELAYVEQMLRLGPEVQNYYREGRAMGITLVASMQRPAGVSRFAHSEAGWTVAFAPKDVEDRERVAEVLGDRATFRHVLDDLDRAKHEFVIRHDRTGQAYISHLPPPRVRSRARKP